MDQVAVRRTRRFVQKYYPHDTITMPDGSKATIKFPTPKPKRIDYTLDDAGNALLDAVVYALDSPDGAPLVSAYHDRQLDKGRLMLARYTPSVYLLDGELESVQVANAGLLKSGLLKRLESSPAALRRTLATLIASHEQFLKSFDQGYVMSTAALNEWSGSEDESLDDWVRDLDDDLADAVRPVRDFHAAELRSDVVDDLELLKVLRAKAEAASRGSDPKLDELVAQLREIATEARRPSKEGLSGEARRKVLIFSTFADTIDDIAAKVRVAVDAAPSSDPLSDYQGRMTDPIKGQKTGVDQEHRARILAGFAPETAGPLDPSGKPKAEDQYDILFTTDVLSEGVNLQQCGRIINYDLPWNPMRLVQRHGRIDRIGSKHATVWLGCFFPAANLEVLLALEERLKRKLAYADAAIGAGEVIPGYHSRFEVTLEDTREQIDKLRAENPELFENGGAAAALSGEEYRKRLSKAMSNPHTERLVKGLPWTAGSGFVNPNAARSGYVFCMKMGEHPTPWFRFVPADPTTWEARSEREAEGSGWVELPPVGEVAAAEPTQEQVAESRIIVESDTLTSLIAADPGDPDMARVLPEVAFEKAYDAWDAARDTALVDWQRLTDPNNLMPEPPKALRDAAELVYRAGQGALAPAHQMDLLARLNSAPPARVVRDIRGALNSAKTDADKITEIREIVIEAGLTPAEAPEALPWLEPVDVHLIAWMAVQGRDASVLGGGLNAVEG